jgi:hypothetical protein
MIDGAGIRGRLPRTELLWLADAPLFIDAAQVDQFYDAVVRPENHTGDTTLTITEAKASKASGKLAGKAGVELAAEASLSPGGLLDILTGWFPFIKAEAKASAKGAFEGAAEGGMEREKRDENARTVVLHAINTPQRQLEHLTLHYLVNCSERLFLVDDPRASEDWRNPETISDVPRALLYLDLPGQMEALEKGLPETKLIPAAAEFMDGTVAPLFMEMKAENGDSPPRYPELDLRKARATDDAGRRSLLEALREDRKKYWLWFEQNFSATRAMEVVEHASAARDGIRWIAFRVPITPDGDTLHLHIVPDGKYPVGTFAYNFIKRGLKHGLRIVGTLKSEPDVNVLAIYEK